MKMDDGGTLALLLSGGAGRVRGGRVSSLQPPSGLPSQPQLSKQTDTRMRGSSSLVLLLVLVIVGGASKSQGT
jgi:hypothetical protein